MALLRVDRRLERGKFWESTPKQFTSQPKVNRDHIIKCAEETGLDMDRFEAMDTGGASGTSGRNAQGLMLPDDWGGAVVISGHAYGSYKISSQATG
jgi:hypothetical protein